MDTPRQDEGWHRRLLPETREEEADAASTFLKITHWKEVTTSAMVELMAPWFAHDWCLDALIRAIDYKPDGSRQDGKVAKNWERHFKRRMSEWFDSDGERIKPPIAPLSAEQVLEVRKRQRKEQRPQGRRTAESERTRQTLITWLSETDRARHEDRVREALRSSERNTSALDSIFPGARFVEPEEDFDKEVGISSKAKDRDHHITAMRVSGLDKVRLPPSTDPNYRAAKQVAQNRLQSYRRALARAKLDDTNNE